MVNYVTIRKIDLAQAYKPQNKKAQNTLQLILICVRYEESPCET